VLILVDSLFVIVYFWNFVCGSKGRLILIKFDHLFVYIYILISSCCVASIYYKYIIDLTSISIGFHPDLKKPTLKFIFYKCIQAPLLKDKTIK
jgi:hypothetical protein